MTRSAGIRRDPKERERGSVEWLLWVLGFDDHAADRYRDPPSPLSRAFLAACEAERDRDLPGESSGDEPPRKIRGTLLPPPQPS